MDGEMVKNNRPWLPLPMLWEQPVFPWLWHSHGTVGWKILFRPELCPVKKQADCVHGGDHWDHWQLHFRSMYYIPSQRKKNFYFYSKKLTLGTSLVAQWLSIRLPMQGTWVRALVWEDPTCHGATKPTYHNYWPCALEPESHNYWARVPQLLKPMHLEPVLRNKEKSLQWEARVPHNKE